MNVSSINEKCINWDRVCRGAFIISTPVNFVELFIKLAIDCKLIPQETLLKHHFFTYLKAKSYEETLWSLIPVIGVIFVYYFKQRLDEKILSSEPALIELDALKKSVNDETLQRVAFKRPEIFNYLSGDKIKKLVNENERLLNYLDVKNLSKLSSDSLISKWKLRNTKLINSLNDKPVEEIKKFLKSDPISINFIKDIEKLKVIIGDEPNLINNLQPANTNDLEIIETIIENNIELIHHLSQIKPLEFILKHLPGLILLMEQEKQRHFLEKTEDISLIRSLLKQDPRLINLFEEMKKIEFLLKLDPELVNALEWEIAQAVISEGSDLIDYLKNPATICRLIDENKKVCDWLNKEHERDPSVLRHLLLNKSKGLELGVYVSYSSCGPSYFLDEDPKFISFVEEEPEALLFLKENYYKDKNYVIDKIIEENKKNSEVYTSIEVNSLLTLCVPLTDCMTHDNLCSEYITEYADGLFKNICNDTSLAMKICWYDRKSFFDLIRRDRRFFRVAIDTFLGKGDKLSSYVPNSDVIIKFISELLLEDPDLFDQLTDDERKNEVLMENLVKSFPEAMKYASEDLKKDEIFIKKCAANGNTSYLQHIDLKHLDDFEFLKSLGIGAFLYASENCLNQLTEEDWQKIINPYLRSLNHPISTFYGASTAFFSRVEGHLLKAIKIELAKKDGLIKGEVYVYLVKNHLGVLKEIIKTNPKIIVHIIEEKIDEDIIFDLIKINPKTIKAICLGSYKLDSYLLSESGSQKLLEDPTTSLAIFKWLKKSGWGSRFGASLAKQLIRKDLRFMRYLSEKLCEEDATDPFEPTHKQIIEIVSELIGKNPNLFSFLTQEQLADSNHITRWLRHFPEVLEYTDDKFRKNKEWIKSYIGPDRGYLRTPQLVNRLLKILRFMHDSLKEDVGFMRELNDEGLGVRVFLGARKECLDRLTENEWMAILKACRMKPSCLKWAAPEFLEVVSKEFPETLILMDDGNNTWKTMIMGKYLREDSHLHKLPLPLLQKIYALQFLSLEAAGNWKPQSMKWGKLTPIINTSKI